METKVIETKLRNVFNSADQDLGFDVNTPQFLKEACEGANGGMYAVCYNIFKGLLTQVAERATELHDPVLDALMIRLNLYEVETEERYVILGKLAANYDAAIKAQKLQRLREVREDAKETKKILIPELKESENERIRKELIDYINSAYRHTLDLVRKNSFIDWLEKQGEQNPIIEMKTSELSLDIDSDTYNKIVDECVYGEQKPAWSEDDDQYLLVCKNALAKYQVSDKWDATIISRWLENKLKSLRPQSTWKPTKKQIIALRWVLNNVPYNKYKEEISGLLDQIKDL